MNNNEETKQYVADILKAFSAIELSLTTTNEFYRSLSVEQKESYKQSIKQSLDIPFKMLATLVLDYEKLNISYSFTEYLLSNYPASTK